MKRVLFAFRAQGRAKSKILFLPLNHTHICNARLALLNQTPPPRKQEPFFEGSNNA